MGTYGHDVSLHDDDVLLSHDKHVRSTVWRSGISIAQCCIAACLEIVALLLDLISPKQRLDDSHSIDPKRDRTLSRCPNQFLKLRRLLISSPWSASSSTTGASFKETPIRRATKPTGLRKREKVQKYLNLHAVRSQQSQTANTCSSASFFSDRHSLIPRKLQFTRFIIGNKAKPCRFTRYSRYSQPRGQKA